MALLTPVPLTQIWNVTHGLTRCFGTSQPGHDVQLASGALLRAGRFEQAGDDDLGCTLIIFDVDTGEPTQFVSHLMVNTPDDRFLSVHHFPDDNAVVLFATSEPATLTSHQVYGQRVEYDIGAGTLTPGPLATWTPNSGTNDKTDYAADVPDSGTINVFAWGDFNATSATLDLVAGTVGTPTDYTVDEILGGGRDRFTTGIPGRHGDGAVLLSGYVAASGVATAETFVVPFAASPGAPLDTGLGRLTGGGITVPLADRTLLTAVSFNGGAPADHYLDASGLTAAAASEVRAGATIHASSPQWTYRADDATLVAYNREGATFNAFNTLTARRYNPTTGQELGAWEYPSTYTFFDQVGMLTPNRRFWWADIGTTQFRVYEAPASDAWNVGFVGWSG